MNVSADAQGHRADRWPARAAVLTKGLLSASGRRVARAADRRGPVPADAAATCATSDVGFNTREPRAVSGEPVAQPLRRQRAATLVDSITDAARRDCRRTRRRASSNVPLLSGQRQLDRRSSVQGRSYAPSQSEQHQPSSRFRPATSRRWRCRWSAGAASRIGTIRRLRRSSVINESRRAQVLPERESARRCGSVRASNRAGQIGDCRRPARRQVRQCRDDVPPTMYMPYLQEPARDRSSRCEPRAIRRRRSARFARRCGRSIRICR